MWGKRNRHNIRTLDLRHRCNRIVSDRIVSYLLFCIELYRVHLRYIVVDYLLNFDL